MAAKPFDTTTELNVMITGGAGFIGSHLMVHFLEHTRWNLVCVDKLTYSSKGWGRLRDMGVLDNPRVKCHTWDLEKPFGDGLIKELGDINIIIHMAAETHVDKSISNPIDVIRNNVMSTVYMLEYARGLKNLMMFHFFNTDEIYGTTKGPGFKESDAHNPTNPYSASKSAGEQICLAYANSFKVPLLATSLMNVFGSYQYMEKFIPMTIGKLLAGEPIIIHTEPDGVTSGTRFYIHAQNVASAILFILTHGKPGQRYNIPGSQEVSNLELAQKIAAIMDRKLVCKFVSNDSARPGHDTRYCLDGGKLASLGWAPPDDFDERLRETVMWTLDHPEWLEP